MSPGPGVRKPGPVLLCSPSLSLVPFARTPPNLPAEAVMTVKVTAEGACGVVEGCHCQPGGRGCPGHWHSHMHK